MDSLKLIKNGRVLVSLLAGIRNPGLIYQYFDEGPSAVTVAQVARLLACEHDKLVKALAEIGGDPDSILTAIGQRQRKLRHVDSSTCHGSQVLYLVTRVLRPEVVVETGVANGLSSAYILAAMRRNSTGTLYSIDLPNPELLPPREKPGWIIPKVLRNRWELHLGDARAVLPGLLSHVKTCDMFLHDSAHTYDHMLWEFATAWDTLADEGMLLSDDIWVNRSLFDFAKTVNRSVIPLYFANMGGLRKWST